MRGYAVFATVVLGLAVAACAPGPDHRSAGAGPAMTGVEGERVHGFAGGTAIQDEWWHAKFGGETEYRLVAVDGQVAIRAAGRDSASGLYRRVEVDPARCPLLEWSWRVDELQRSADLTTKQGDDVAASLFVLFGDPGMMSSPDPVPTLRYVWTNDRAAPGMFLANPYLPEVVHNVVVRSGASALGGFVTERRDLGRDFRQAFPGLQVPRVQAIAIFTDNDQTGEAVTAYYAHAGFLCDAATGAGG